MTKEYIGEAFREPYCEALKKGPVIWQAAFLGSDERVWAESIRLELPDFNKHALYRFKPVPKRMVTMYDAQGKPHQLVAPERAEPAQGTMFFLVNLAGITHASHWDGCDAQLSWLENGSIFLTTKDAEAMADFQRQQRSGEI